MRCTKFYSQPEVVRNQNLQLLCYVIFFDILDHYGVIAASQICSVSRKYCAVLRNRFLLSRLYEYRESIAFAQKIDFQILMNVHVLRPTESKKVIFVCLSVCVCVCVCVSVCGHHNSKNN